MNTRLYIKNRPLINSTLIGTAYLLFCWSLDFDEGAKWLFYVLMLFLPGLTFPLSTTYYNLKQDSNIELRVTAHIILSVLIYHGSVWIFSAEGRIEHIAVLAGLSGSLFYSLVTKYLLRKRLTFFQIALTSVLSGLVFIPLMTGKSGGSAITMGLPILLWTVLNGFLMNLEYKTIQR